MLWFSARTLLRCEVQGDKRNKILFEEIIFLVRAHTKEEARKRAFSIARKKQHSYNNVFKDKVRWKFHRLLEVQELISQRLMPGTEVYWRLFRKGRP